ncbi:hypothetical protein [Streptomyces xanthochromogenes]
MALLALTRRDLRRKAIFMALFVGTALALLMALPLAKRIEKGIAP